MEFLHSNEGRQEIESAVATLQRLGIHGIPKFIIEGQTLVDGAAQADVFVDIFRRIEARGSLVGGPVFGEILGISPQVLQQPSHDKESLAAAA